MWESVGRSEGVAGRMVMFAILNFVIIFGNGNF
jgi:hypothetical protein